MIGFLFEIFTALMMIALVLFFGLAFFMSFISELLNLDKERNNYSGMNMQVSNESVRDYELRKMNETLTRNRNDSLTRQDHYGNK